MNDLIAGRVDAMFNALASLLQPVRAGQVRALAVTTAERVPAVHELPTFAESDVRGFEIASWYAFYLPAKTPPESIKKIQADTMTALMQPAIRGKFAPLGSA